MAPGPFPPGDLKPDNVNLKIETAERRALTHNEQTKLRATILNTVAGGLVIAGIITPLASLILNGAGLTYASVMLMVIWFLGAIILHSGRSGRPGGAAMTGTVILTAIVTLIAAGAFSLASVVEGQARSALQVDSLREEARRAAHSTTATRLEP
ncbi:hypothetical protein ACU4GR_33820 (plasmid) [Methylobacterium oryzae CBMB20]